MKFLIGLLLLTCPAPAQSNSIGVCATPHMVDGRVVLSASLVGDVETLPRGTIVRLMRGQTVVSTMIIGEKGRLPAELAPMDQAIASSLVPSAIGGLALGAIAQEGDTVSITSPTGNSFSVAISVIIIGTLQVGNTLSVVLINTSPSASVFIDGRPLSVSNLSLGTRGFVSVDSTIYHGWHLVTACQPGVCDTVIVRLP